MRGRITYTRIPKAADAKVPTVLCRGQYSNEIVGTDGETKTTVDNYCLSSKHFLIGTKQAFMVCSAGLKEVESEGRIHLVEGDKECVGCYYKQSTDRDQEAPGDNEGVISQYPTINRIYPVVLLAHFHRVKVGVRKFKGREYDNFEHHPCEGEGCKLCENPDNQRYFARKGHMGFGKMTTGALEDVIEEELAHACECGKEIVTFGFRCPECHKGFKVDWNKLPLPRKAELLYGLHECKSCKKVVALREVIQCECGDPRGLELPDCAITFEQRGTGRDTTLVLLEFELWEDMLLRFLDEEEITKKEYDEARTMILTPLDLSREITPLDCDEQASLLRRNNPYRSSTPDARARNRNGGTRLSDLVNDRDTQSGDFNDDDIPF